MKSTENIENSRMMQYNFLLTKFPFRVSDCVLHLLDEYAVLSTVFLSLPVEHCLYNPAEHLYAHCSTFLSTLPHFIYIFLFLLLSLFVSDPASFRPGFTLLASTHTSLCQNSTLLMALAPQAARSLFWIDILHAAFQKGQHRCVLAFISYFLSYPDGALWKV